MAWAAPSALTPNTHTSRALSTAQGASPGGSPLSSPQGTGLLWLPGGIKLFAVFYTFGNIAALARCVRARLLATKFLPSTSRRDVFPWLWLRHGPCSCRECVTPAPSPTARAS